MSEELKELRTIKKLLVLLLTKNEATNVEIAKTLGVDESVVRRILSPRGEKDPKEKTKDD
jgi:predicted ArsR family transcriptional regulator